MKNRICYFIAIIFLICAKPGFCTKFRDFTDIKWGYKTKYPVTWTARSMPNSTDLVKADFSSRNRKGGVQVRIYPNTGGDFDKFCKWYVAQFVKDMQKQWGGSITVLRQRKCKIGRNEGYLVDYDFKRGDGKRFYLINHIWPRGDKVYLFQSGCPFDSKGSFESLVTEMANDFDFVK